MMGKRDTAERHQIKLISIDDMVPKNHLKRKIDRAIDLSFIYDKVENLYKPYGQCHQVKLL